MVALFTTLALAVSASPTVLEAEPATIECGELKAGAPLVKQFRVTNASGKPVKLTEPSLSCGCTKHSFDKTTLGPKETATLTVAINTLAQPAGLWSWSATIRGRAENEASDITLPLKITGTLVREVSIEPSALAFSLESGEMTKRIAIVDKRGQVLATTKVTSSAKWLVTDREANGKLNSQSVNVAVSADAPPGVHRESIIIATNDPVYPEFQIPVTVLKQKPELLKAYPDAVELSKTDRTQLVQFRRPDGKSLKIQTCETGYSDLELAWSKDAGLVATMKVTLKSDAVPALADIVVRFADPPCALVLPVRAVKD